MTSMTIGAFNMSDLLNSQVPLSSETNVHSTDINLDANRDKPDIGESERGIKLGNEEGFLDGVTLKEISSEIVSPLSDTPTLSKERTETKLIKTNEKVFEKSWMRPALISTGVAIVVFSGLAYSLSGSGTTETAENASISMDIDKSEDGRNSLNVEQAKYLSDKQREEASKNAEEGVTNAAIVTAITPASAVTNTYTTSNKADMTAITSKRQDIAMTVAQLDSQPDTYLRMQSDEGKIYFKNQKTGEIIYPSDGLVYENMAKQQKLNQINGSGGNTAPVASPAPVNATMYTGNTGSTGGDGGSSGNSGANGNGGNNQVATGSNQDQQRPADPDLERSRQLLYNDYEEQTKNDQAQQEAINSQQQAFLAQQQALLANRQKLANDNINAVIQDFAKPNAQDSFTAQPYYRAVQVDANGNPVNGNRNQNTSNNQNTANQNNFNNATTQNSQGYGGVGNFKYTDNNVTLSPNGELTNQATQKSVGTGGYGALDANGVTTNGLLPKNVLRAGTTWQMIVTNSVNTDEGLQVVGEIINGKFSGSKLYGIATPQGRSIGVNFTQILPPNPRKPAIPIQAMATTVFTEKTAVATSKDNHYGQNYGVMVLTSAIEGYGSAYSGTGTTVVNQSDGTVITSKDDKVSSKEITGNIANQVGSRLSQDIAKLGERPPTFKIAQGTVLNVVLTQNLDINAITDTLAITNNSYGSNNNNR